MKATTLTGRPTGSGAMTGCEPEVWAIADSVRDAKDAVEFERGVLGLIFLMCISDSPDESPAAVLAEWGEESEQDRDEYTAEYIYWVPQEFRWINLTTHRRPPIIGQAVD